MARADTQSSCLPHSQNKERIRAEEQLHRLPERKMVADKETWFAYTQPLASAQ